ncbi:hypothetical protein TOI97_04460 [Denitrificimonas sp. JX-1]|uniref:30S ribosomal protein S3 n=1 Tax=Denitrificimonas halotolerans TaxID=3098930 RepID=A0ABU5GQK4_9GAMM|nr:hypothetical protein [Denitrificimonas sp. JX-1]MDY7218822.1 hypothetical protein [Denitrificimonas sp. JX-1]
MDYFIVAIVTLSGLYFHWWIYVRIKRWINRDFALSLAPNDPDKQAYMLNKLNEAEALKIKKGELQGWLQTAADQYHSARSTPPQ